MVSHTTRYVTKDLPSHLHAEAPPTATGGVEVKSWALAAVHPRGKTRNSVWAVCLSPTLQSIKQARRSLPRLHSATLLLGNPAILLGNSGGSESGLWAVYRNELKTQSKVKNCQPHTGPGSRWLHVNCTGTDDRDLVLCPDPPVRRSDQLTLSYSEAVRDLWVPAGKKASGRAV